MLLRKSPQRRYVNRLFFEKNAEGEKGGNGGTGSGAAASVRATVPVMILDHEGVFWADETQKEYSFSATSFKATAQRFTFRNMQNSETNCIYSSVCQLLSNIDFFATRCLRSKIVRSLSMTAVLGFCMLFGVETGPRFVWRGLRFQILYSIVGFTEIYKNAKK